ncbi:DNA alkylation repair protein [Olivibacter sitiensis]|uniref:DNA alkylation repair protein n=1 Tax=Olivibacter sitiensis TaxID=376470 RepID=UPI00042A2891|nr:DNA alkylation repair protein [Olivibacter sitiensis]
MKEKFIKELRTALLNNADLATRKSSSRFFKKGDEALVYGVKTAEANKIAKEFWKQAKSFSKEDVFAICEKLWKSRYLEEAIIACQFTESLEKQYEPTDFGVFEHWVNNYVNNWVDCDTLCNHTIGTFIMMYPEYISELKKWATSSNRWTKRASAVTLIIPARKGLFLKEIFEIADILLLDKDDLVQKGYGWMLKAASESNQEKVFDYIISKREIMPRTALRYAIEKMPKELKIEAMKK